MLLKLLTICIIVYTYTAVGHASPAWPRTLESVIARFGSPTKPSPDVINQLPTQRLQQPWAYRSLQETSHGLKETESYALVATVSHTLQGVTTDMLLWWFDAVFSPKEVPYAGNTSFKASLYLQWHPRDHILTEVVEQAKGKLGPIWRIAEFFTSPKPGYTLSTYDPTKHVDATYPYIDAATRITSLDHGGLTMTAPEGPFFNLLPPESIMLLQHAWKDAPEGVQLTSTFQVGVADPGHVPLFLVRLYNALVRGLYGQGFDSRHPLSKWIVHCAEEFGNLQRILPDLYAQRATLFEAENKAAATGLHAPGQAQEHTAEL